MSEQNKFDEVLAYWDEQLGPHETLNLPQETQQICANCTEVFHVVRKTKAQFNIFQHKHGLCEWCAHNAMEKMSKKLCRELWERDEGGSGAPYED